MHETSLRFVSSSSVQVQAQASILLQQGNTCLQSAGTCSTVTALMGELPGVVWTLDPDTQSDTLARHHNMGWLQGLQLCSETQCK